MTTAEIALVNDSLRRVAANHDRIAALFYARLFELDPSLRPLFRGDMAEQGRQLMRVLSFGVRSLNRFDAILPALRQLGTDQAACGVREEHYAAVGNALLWTLEKTLGPGFTPEVRAAWRSTYATLANAMIAAARAAQPTAA
jgi:nitric oxide dioxygenase